jgi:hypothetical protein
MKVREIALSMCCVLGSAGSLAATPSQVPPGNQMQSSPAARTAFTVDAQIAQLKAEIASLKAALAAQASTVDQLASEYRKHTHDFAFVVINQSTTAATCGDPDLCKNCI